MGDNTIVLDDKDRTLCEVWSRVMGYHRPVDQWNAGKQSEHRERTHFKEHGALFSLEE
jgi:anaerobic ribonucleoside-triphosphate reductase